MTTYTGTDGKNDVATIAATSAQTSFSIDAQGRWVVTSPAGTNVLERIEHVQLQDARLTLGVPGAETQIAPPLWGTQQGPSITTLSDGGQVLVYFSDGNKFAQRFDGAGERVGSPILVGTDGSWPVVAPLSNGGFVVAWKSNGEPDSSGYLQGEILAQRFDAAGSKVGIEMEIARTGPTSSSYGGSNDGPLSITGFPDGSFAVAYYYLNTVNANTSYIGVLHYSAEGRLLGGGSTGHFSSYGHQLEPHVTALSDGGYVVTWSGNGPLGQGIYLQRYDLSDNPVGSYQRVNTDTTLALGSQVLAAPDGGFVVLWQANGNSVSGFDASGYGLYMQRYDMWGAKVGGEKLVNTTTFGNQVSGGVATLDGGGFVATWEASDGSGYGIYLQRFDDTGEKVGPELRANTVTSGEQGRPQVTALPGGGFIVSWHSAEGGIMTQRFDAGGSPALSALAGDAAANMLSFDGSQSVHLQGMDGDDTLSGGSGHDLLDGGMGFDSMRGGAGNDTYVVDAGDVVSEAGGSGVDTVRASFSYTLGEGLENLVLTGLAAASGTGNGLDNDISGNSGDNVLNGRGGKDTLRGGLGEDIYHVDSAGDVVIETGTSAREVDRVFATASFTLGANLEHLTLTGTAAIHGTGNALANRLTGNGAANRLSGAGGADTLDGGAGSDTLHGGTGNDTYYVDATGDQVIETSALASEIDAVFASASFTLGANIERLTLTGGAAIDGTGNAQNNLLTGNAAANVLNGGGGVDTLVGGAGKDTYVVDSSDDVVVESGTLAREIDEVRSSVSWTLGERLENLTLTGSSFTRGTGNELNNRLTGSDAANVLDGREGKDTMAGGLGRDVYYVDSAGDVVIETSTLATERDLVFSTVSHTLAANLEELQLLGTASINGRGNTLDNLIHGNAAANVLDGGGGADTLQGSTGNDTYVVDSAGDVVRETSTQSGEIDTVRSSVSYVLGANLENLVLTGAAALDGTGNELGNRITGNAAANLLDGGSGNDTLSGGLGNDVYVVDSMRDRVVETSDLASEIDAVIATVSWTLGANLEHLTLTGAAAINGTGNALDNRMTGNDAANILRGGFGNDTLVGGGGKDIYVVDAAGDVIEETSTAPGETDTVRSSVSWRLGANLENLVLLGSGATHGWGNELNNRITGNAAANLLDGGSGNDTLSGGEGGDTYVVDSARDRVVEASTEASELDTVLSSVSWTLGANLENLVLTGAAAVNGTGNALGNEITGNAAANVLNGGSGNDTLEGGLGNDIYIVDAEGDQIRESGTGGTEIDSVRSSVSWTLGENLENLSLVGTAANNGTGNAQNNTIIGNGGANIIDGGAGDDRMIGGRGSDTYIVDSAGDRVTETSTLADEIDHVQSSVSYRLGANLEYLTLVGSAAIRGTGNGLGNQIVGNDAANWLDGGAGGDTLEGGLGNDTYVVDASGDRVLETSALAGEIDTVRSSISWTLGANLETLVLTGSAALDGSGNDLANLITGNAAANVLDGGAGNDTLVGGAGNDIYIVDAARDLVVERSTLATERDEVRASVSHALRANLEVLTLTGSAAINGKGNALANLLVGNAADNLLDGGGGNDTLSGGLGDDTYTVDSAGDVVIEADSSASEIDTVRSSVSYALGSNLEDLVLIGTAAIDGRGNALANRISGNAAANVLNGGAGDDTLTGGRGNDTYVVDSSGDVVRETSALATEIDHVQSSVSYRLGANLEVLTLTGADAIDGTGNALDNRITGNASANRIDGGKGSDTLAGGMGNDTYVVDAAGDHVVETSTLATEIDHVRASVSFTLGANLEMLTLTGAGAISGTGNSLANRLTGNGAANVLDGGTGNDTLVGGLGNDTYVVDAAGDVVFETSGSTTEIDLVRSSVSWTLGANLEKLTLTGAAAIDGTGNALANTIVGNAGANTLNGGAGRDILTGGAGADSFRFDAPLGSAHADHITDFSVADDTVELDHAVFTALLAGPLPTHSFALGNWATDENVRILYDPATGTLLYDSDGSGMASAVQFATLASGLSLSAQDFVIV